MGLESAKCGFCRGVLLLLVITICQVSGSNYDERQTSTSRFCESKNPQSHIDIDHIMGMWYGSEVLTHHDQDVSDQVYNSCVVIHLSEVTQEMSTTERNLRPGDYGYNNQNRNHQLRYLKLIWDEKGTTLDYLLRFNNSQRGLWIASGPQHGNMLDLHYNQFTGTIQVMKAVGNHLVLTFCQQMPASQLFTVILAREPMSLTNEEIQSIKNLLRRRFLSTTNVRKVCRNSATWTRNSVPLMLLPILSLLVWLRKN